jgi:hypothetical protein
MEGLLSLLARAIVQAPCALFDRTGLCFKSRHFENMCMLTERDSKSSQTFL